jgi:hypothetical protein
MSRPPNSLVPDLLRGANARPVRAAPSYADGGQGRGQRARCHEDFWKCIGCQNDDGTGGNEIANYADFLSGVRVLWTITSR